MPSFTLHYPASVGANWQFSAALIGGQIVITGIAVSSSPTFFILGF